MLDRERLLDDLADGAARLVRARLARGEPAGVVVAEVLRMVLGERAGTAPHDTATVMEIIGIGHNR